MNEWEHATADRTRKAPDTPSWAVWVCLLLAHFVSTLLAVLFALILFVVGMGLYVSYSINQAFKNVEAQMKKEKLK